MITPLLPILSLMAAANAQTGQDAARPTFRVLLVGVDHYSKGNTKWGDLEGTKDVDMIRRVLTMYWGLKPTDIHELRDDKATKEAIEGQFKNWLVKDAKPTDKMLFFFSGHGTLVPAPDLSSGRRSAILPYNAKGDTKGIDAKSLITGEFFRNELRELKRGGVTNLTLMFDACNSATIGRGQAKSKSVHNPALDQAVTPPGPKAEVGISTDLDFKDSMVISAARADRSAWQGDAGGNLTVAFTKAINAYFGRRAQTKVDHDMTYADLKDGIMANLATLPQPSAQEPAFSGGLDREVFGTKTPALDPYYLVTVADGQTTIAAGALFGIGSGAVFSIYAPGTTDFDKTKPMARATVKPGESGPYQSTVSLEGYAGDPKALVGARARLVDGTPDATLAVDLSSLDARPEYHALADEIVKGPLFRRADAGHPLEAKVLAPGTTAKGSDPTPNAWSIDDTAGNRLLTADATTERGVLLDQIKGRLRAVAQRKAVLELKTDLPMVKVEMETVPATVVNELVTALAPPPTGTPHETSAALTAFQPFAVRVRATLASGKEDAGQTAYLAVLDLPPNGKVQPLWPDDARASDKTKIAADGRWLYLARDGSLVAASQPDQIKAWFLDPKDGQGQEVFKLFASDVSDVDYSSLVTTSRGAGKGAESPVGRVLGAFRDGRPLSRAGSATAEPSSFSVATLTFTLRPETGAALPKP